MFYLDCEQSLFFSKDSKGLEEPGKARWPRGLHRRSSLGSRAILEENQRLLAL